VENVENMRYCHTSQGWTSTAI